jgi:hypothetical protein
MLIALWFVSVSFRLLDGGIQAWAAKQQDTLDMNELVKHWHDTDI